MKYIEQLTNNLKIAKAVDDDVINHELVPAFVKLLKDTEAEVRTAIAGQIPGKNIEFDRRSWN
jgi:serine/threonine-protein phosphatase 2A regulatory subunit A